MSSANYFPDTVLVLKATANDAFEPVTPPISAMECGLALQALVRMPAADTNFRCRLAIRQCTDTNVYGAPVATTSKGGSTWVTAPGAAGEKFWRYDPTNASFGDITAAPLFQVGIQYGLATGTTPQDATVEVSRDRLEVAMAGPDDGDAHHGDPGGPDIVVIGYANGKQDAGNALAQFRRGYLNSDQQRYKANTAAAFGAVADQQQMLAIATFSGGGYTNYTIGHTIFENSLDWRLAMEDVLKDPPRMDFRGRPARSVDTRKKTGALLGSSFDVRGQVAAMIESKEKQWGAEICGDGRSALRHRTAYQWSARQVAQAALVTYADAARRSGAYRPAAVALHGWLVAEGLGGLHGADLVAKHAA